MNAPDISTARVPSGVPIAPGRDGLEASCKFSFREVVSVASKNQILTDSHMRGIKFPRTIADYLDWYGMTPAYFHLLIESKVLPPGTLLCGDAVWNFSEVDEALSGLATVYFADVRRRGLIKIGYTTNLYNRIDRLCCDFNDRVVVIKAIPGSFAVESCIHERFDHLRVDGECFWPGLDLFAYIDAVTR